jgi:hypothetical protein
MVHANQTRVLLVFVLIKFSGVSEERSRLIQGFFPLLKWTLKRYGGRKHVCRPSIAQVLRAEGGGGGPEPVTVDVCK